jgi:hypothetical protein
MSTYFFPEACATYKYLLEKGYPEKATLKLVGDRHRLTRMERNCIFRGVVRATVAESRRAKLIAEEEAADQTVSIDWYNVLITVESHLKGFPLFIAEDGVIRDASATHGSYRHTAVTDRAIQEIVRAITALRPSRIEAYLDAPIAFSGLMAEILRERLRDMPCSSEVSLARSADFPLKSARGIVATSDSAILDSAPRVLDLARCVLSRRFGFTPPLLSRLFDGPREASPRSPASGIPCP